MPTENAKTLSKKLVSAAHSGKLAEVKRLLKAGASPDGRDGGVTAIYGALELGKLKVAKLLLDHGADPRPKRSSKSLSALHHAANDVELTKALLRMKLAPNDQNNPKRLAPLHFTRDVQVARELLAAGADVNARNKNGATPLGTAMSRGPALVALLLENGAKWDSSRQLNLALQHAQTATALTLLEHGYPVDARNWFRNETPLIQAAQSNATACVEFLLEHPDTDLDSADSQGFTALHVAAHAGRQQLVKDLLAAAPIPLETTRVGNRPPTWQAVEN